MPSWSASTEPVGLRRAPFIDSSCVSGDGSAGARRDSSREQVFDSPPPSKGAFHILWNRLFTLYGTDCSHFVEQTFHIQHSSISCNNTLSIDAAGQSLHSSYGRHSCRGAISKSELLSSCLLDIVPNCALVVSRRVGFGTFHQGFIGSAHFTKAL